LAASIGIWAQGDLAADVVLYRWEADNQTGFVTLESATQRIRPAGQSGQPIGDLVYDPGTGEAFGTAAGGVERRLFSQIVAAIMRAYRRSGSPPATAHAYYY
jgi:hypothetical protein